MRISQMSWRPSRSIALALFVTLVTAGVVQAAPITAGFDLFTTPAPSPGGASYVFLDADNDPTTGVNGAETQVFLEGNPSAIPPGFFGDDDFFPGVDPVFFTPDPFDEDGLIARHHAKYYNGGAFDTVVRRLADADPQPGAPDTIPIELVALSLRSVDPVNLGGNLFDLQVIGGTDLLPGPPVSPGVMTIFREDPAIDGGTFDSFLPVAFKLIFTARNPNPAFPSTFEVLGFDELTAQGVPWAATIPVPAALPLLLSGLAGLGIVGWRRRKAA